MQDFATRDLCLGFLFAWRQSAIAYPHRDQAQEHISHKPPQDALELFVAALNMRVFVVFDLRLPGLVRSGNGRTCVC